MELDEWDGPRLAAADPDRHDALLLHDTWCSAGTVDYAFETNAFKAVLPARGPFAPPPVPADGEPHVPTPHGGGAGGTGALPAWQRPRNRRLGLARTRCPCRKWPPMSGRPNSICRRIGGSNTNTACLIRKLGCVVSLEEGENRVLEARALAARQWTLVHDENYRRDAGRTLSGGRGGHPGVFAAQRPQPRRRRVRRSQAAWPTGRAGSACKLIQILPINDTTSSHDWTDSYPYSAISVFALHPLYLRIEDLGYAMPAEFAVELDSAREWLNALEHLDYVEVMKAKTRTDPPGVRRTPRDDHRQRRLPPIRRGKPRLGWCPTRSSA